MILHPDRQLPADPGVRALARALFASVERLPIISPHGHTEARWFAENRPFADPASLLVTPDHYIFRMLYSQGVTLEELGLKPADASRFETDPARVWQVFAAHYHLFRGTPTRAWLDHTLATLFGIEDTLCAATAQASFERIAGLLATEPYRPRALFERFNIEVLATTDSPLDDLASHQALRDSGWTGRVVPTYRPDALVDPSVPGFAERVWQLGERAGCDTSRYAGYLEAHRIRRQAFRALGATATDHGHPSARTADLARDEAASLYDRLLAGRGSPEEAELFRAQMLTEFAAMSLEDGLVMQLHPGAVRNHNPALFARFGANMGADIPARTDYVAALKPLLDRFGNDPRLTLILFTVDETSFSRELAPLAGHYPALLIGPPWWFLDSPHAMRRFREATVETAGFYNTVGFNDDTRAFPSIPARHDVARRVDCAYLAELVATHRLAEHEAAEVAHALAYDLPRRAYRL